MTASSNSAPTEASAPANLAQVLPPDRAYVTLSEALSWIAFRKSENLDALFVRLSDDVASAPDAHQSIGVALNELLNLGRSGQIPFVGKHLSSSGNDVIAAAQTLAIDPVNLIDFGQFDVVRDGLRCGTGMTWRLVNGAIQERAQQVRRDYYHSVQVGRTELLARFPPKAEPPQGVPIMIAVGDMTCPGDDFDLHADVAVSPWWSVSQAVGWIATGSKSYVGYVAELEAAGGDEIASSVAFSMIVTYIARKHCRCAAHNLPDDQRWEHCTCTGDAGRELLEAIRIGSVTPTQRIGGGPKTVTFHDLAGIGQRPTCIDWLDVKPALQFSSAEVRAAFLHTENVPEGKAAGDVAPDNSGNATPLRTGDPGRPPKGYQLYVAEHIRRCGAGEAMDKVAHEAEHLARWYALQYPNADPVSAGTVENRIRSKHRQYCASKPHEIIASG